MNAPAPFANRPEVNESLAALASHGQRQLWLFDQMYGGGAAHNLPVTLRLKGPLDPHVLRRSLDEIIRRHESLRTNLVATEGELLQVITSASRLDLPVVDLSGTPEATHLDLLVTRVEHEAVRPFDLAEDRLIRGQLLRLADHDHVLALVIHHTVFDGWSESIFISELCELYTAFLQGLPSPLAELPLQYADFAEWQRSDETKAALEPSVTHWREQLADVPSLNLGFDSARRPLPSHGGGLVSTVLPASVAERLEAFSLAENATLFMTLFTAYAVLLHRYSGQTDLLVGVPVAGRSRAELEPLIGYFNNTLPLRVSLAAERSFRANLRHVRAMIIKALEHQDLPYERMLEATKATERPSVLQALFVLQSTPKPPVEFAGISIEPLRIHSRTAKFDLLMQTRRTAEGLVCSLEYSSDLYDRPRAACLLEHYRTLLAVSIDASETAISQLDFLTPDEREALLAAGQGPVTNVPDERVDQIVMRQAHREPRRIALIGETTLSYRDLAAVTDRVLGALLAHGVRPGDRVATCLARGISSAVLPLAIWRAGAVYVPLDPHHPVDRLRYIIADARPSVVVVDDASHAVLSRDGGRFAQWDEVASGTADSFVAASDPESLAYVLYTSGSTGTPKGVQVPHRALTNLMVSIQGQPGIRPDDTLLALSTVAFDISLVELLLPLTSGARLMVASREAAANPSILAVLLDDHDVTMMQATPTTWRMLVDTGWRPPRGFTAISGGEALPVDLAATLLSQGGRLWNGYGPTETAIYSTMNQVVSGEPISIGGPIANTSLYVLDEHRALVPRGSAGELYIGGIGVGDGYLNRPDLTAERFLTNPFDPAPGSRMYRTGDRVQLRADGSLAYEGRTDFQVKLRGFRIELGEIEARLREDPSVAEAVVVLREDSPDDRRLAAYVVPAAQAAIDTVQLRDWLRTKLPDYMVPATLVRLDRLPRTPNDKIDRRRLPAPAASDLGTSHEHVAARSDVEAALAEIWCEVLKLERVSVEANFFDLGGHSLIAIRLFSEIQRRLGQQLRFGLLLEHPTIAGLAAVIESDRTRAERSSVLPLQPQGSAPPLFLVHGIGGEVWSYLPLAKRMAPDVPVFGIYFQDDLPERPVTVASMAARYIDDLFRIAPKGPYYLGGFCSGAIIALEMAHQLLQQQKDVALVVILDHALVDTTLEVSRLGRMWDMIRNAPLWLVDDLWAVGAAEVWGRFKSRARVTKGMKQRQLGNPSAPPIDIRDTLGMWRFPDEHVRILESQWSAIRSHRHRSSLYPGPVALIKPRALPLLARRQAEDLGWRQFISGDLTIIKVPGSHETMLNEPFTITLSQRLRELLDEVQADAANSQMRHEARAAARAIGG